MLSGKIACFSRPKLWQGILLWSNLPTPSWLSLKGVRGRFAQVGGESHITYKCDHMCAKCGGREEGPLLHAGLFPIWVFDNYCAESKPSFCSSNHLFAATNSCFKWNACTACLANAVEISSSSCLCSWFDRVPICSWFSCQCLVHHTGMTQKASLWDKLAFIEEWRCDFGPHFHVQRSHNGEGDLFGESALPCPSLPWAAHRLWIDVCPLHCPRFSIWEGSVGAPLWLIWASSHCNLAKKG